MRFYDAEQWGLADAGEVSELGCGWEWGAGLTALDSHFRGNDGGRGFSTGNSRGGASGAAPAGWFGDLGFRWWRDPLAKGSRPSRKVVGKAGHWVACVTGHTGVHPHDVARPGCRRWMDLELATAAAGYGCRYRRVGPVQLPGLTTLQSTCFNSSSCREGAAVWRRLGFAVFRSSGWGLRIP